MAHTVTQFAQCSRLPVLLRCQRFSGGQRASRVVAVVRVVCERVWSQPHCGITLRMLHVCVVRGTACAQRAQRLPAVATAVGSPETVPASTIQLPQCSWRCDGGEPARWRDSCNYTQGALQELLLLPQGPWLTAWGVLTRAHGRHSTAQHTSSLACQAKLPAQKAFACTSYQFCHVRGLQDH